MDEPDNRRAADFFVEAMEQVLGPRMRDNGRVDDIFCRQVWGALTNVEWINERGQSVLFTFRSAAATMVSLLDEGDYVDWYCCGPTGVVSDEIREALKAEGWVPVIQALK
jgi:hypothetical protein